jgi:peptidoglycan/LPS O-acetylase OafA/YrhL
MTAADVAARRSPTAFEPDHRPASTEGHPHEPAIDGLRGIAVLAVLLFHAELNGADGGYLGVSVFFTISGYVVTRSLLDRRSRNQSFSVLDFYGRRIKRLLPASTITLLVVIGLSRAGLLGTVSSSEVRWTALHGANWYQLATGGDYARAFNEATGGASPIVHYWSLAIEEQFYLVWPVLLTLAMVRKGRYALPAVAMLFVGFSAATMLLAPRAGSGSTYFNSFMRFAEILVGCVIALGLQRWPVRRLAPAWPVALAGLIGAAIILTDNSPTAWPYRGRLPLFAVLVGALIVSLQVPGPVHRALSSRPPVAIGRISYGIYLVHWPVIQLVDRMEIARGASILAAVGLSMIVASMLYVVVEQPVRNARFGAPGGFAMLALALGMVALTGAIAGLQPRPTLALFEVDQERVSAVAIEQTIASDDASIPSVGESSRPLPELLPAAPSTSTTVAPLAPTRVLLVGDSTAEALGAGMVDWVYETRPDMQVTVAAHGACGLVRGGEYHASIFNAALQTNCAELHEMTIPALLGRADLVVVLTTLADVWERSWDGGEQWLTPSDPEFATRIMDDYKSFFSRALEAGAKQVVWLRPPVSSYPTHDGVAAVDPSFLNGNQEVVEAVVAQLHTRWPDQVVIADFRDWYETSSLASDPEARPDGTHLSAAGGRRVVADWLGPLLLELTSRSNPAGDCADGQSLSC